MKGIGIFQSILLIFVFGFTLNLSNTPYNFPELKFFPKMPVEQDNPVTIEGANLGRHLFYDPILSIDSSISCSSCHKQQFAFSDSPNDLSTGSFGQKMMRNTLPLFNLAWYPSYFWDGRAFSLEEQVFHPLRATNEMNINWLVTKKKLEENKFYRKLFLQAFGKVQIDSIQVTYAIAQFLRTLISYQSKYDKVISGSDIFTKDEYDGFVLVNDQTKGDCIHCHITDGDVLGTTLVFSNNGLDSAVNAAGYADKGRGAITGNSNDYGKFKVPSLRNLKFTAPYMHDGRFKTLEEVIEFYSTGLKMSPNIDSKMEYAHRGGVNLSVEEKKKIISFLLTMSDSTFITENKYSNPFTN